MCGKEEVMKQTRKLHKHLVDTFPIKINQTGGGVIYDNQQGAGDNDDPTTALGRGSIKIHKGSANKEAAETVTTEAIPESYGLELNYPNPFNPTTTIAYSLSHTSEVVLTIYNPLGQEVKTLVNEVQTPGNKLISWDGTDNQGDMVGAGIYIYSIRKCFYKTILRLLFILSIFWV
jgi:hypothetical protein